MTQKVQKFILQIINSKLHSSSLYILIAQGLITVLGYLFWVIVSRLFNAEDVGIASSLITASLLVAQISILGFNQSLVRFMPKATSKNAMMNSSLIVTIFVSAALSMIAFTFLNHPSQQGSSLIYAAIFVATTILTSLKNYADTIFLVSQRTASNILVYGLFGVARIAIPIIFISGGSIAILLANLAGLLLATAASFYIFYKQLDYRFSPKIDWSILRKLSAFSGASHLAGIFWVLPMMIVPSISLHLIGAKETAYAYIAITIFNILLILPTSTTQSLYAESVHGGTGQFANMAKSTLKFTYAIQILAIIMLLIFGHIVLQMFGKEYVEYASGLLYTLIPLSVFATLNMVGNTALKAQDMISTLISVNVIGAILTLAMLVIVLPSVGLVGIAVAYGVGQIAMLLGHLRAQLYLRGLTFRPAVAAPIRAIDDDASRV